MNTNFLNSKTAVATLNQWQTAYRKFGDETPTQVILSDHDISFAVENWFKLLRK